MLMEIKKIKQQSNVPAKPAEAGVYTDFSR